MGLGLGIRVESLRFGRMCSPKLRCMRIRACMHACMHVCMHACMHVCMYACMYVCMHACTPACQRARRSHHVCVCMSMHVCMYAYCTHSRIVHTSMAYITLFYTHRLVWGSYTNVGMVDTCVWARRRACRFVRARMPMRVLSDTCSCWLKSSSRSRVKDGQGQLSGF